MIIIKRPRITALVLLKISNFQGNHAVLKAHKHLFVERSLETRNYCTNKTLKSVPAVGIISKVLSTVGFTPNIKTRIKVSSHILYENVADGVNYLKFFQYFNMPNTFNSWFLVTELHVWMYLVRSMSEGSDSGQNGRFMRNCIVEAMWGDVNTRAKKLGDNNSSRIREQIQILSEQFQAALIAYDEGIMLDDRVLAAALWRRFLEMNSNDFTRIDVLVRYVRKQLNALESLPPDNFLLKPKFSWLELDSDESEK